MIYAVNKETKEHRPGGIIKHPDWTWVEADDGGWIAWESDEPGAPVSAGQRCRILMSDDSEFEISYPEAWDWSEGGDQWITAYRPIFDAQDEPAEPEAPEWDGEGRPPVGCECEWSDAWRPHKRVLVMGYYGDSAWLRVFNDDGSDWPTTVHFNLESFRPLRTTAQRAEDEAIADLSDAINDIVGGFSDTTLRAIARTVYRAGYRKEDSP